MENNRSFGRPARHDRGRYRELPSTRWARIHSLPPPRAPR